MAQACRAKVTVCAEAGTRLAATAVVGQAACFISPLMRLSGCAFATTFPKAQALSGMRWEREGGGGERPSI